METVAERLAREAAEAAERIRKAMIRGQINNLNSTRKRYSDARDKVSAAKTDVDSVKSSWESSVNSLNGTDIVIDGSFEGEMAEKLKSKVDSSVEENQRYLSDAGNLITELTTQISKIDTRINEIDQQISNLRAQL
ncbi:MAG: hypothetical protein ACOYA9_00275 [Bilifractor sp.]|jgi:ElaB/YqjD/DUF883 family membrane-anchored ribosome-binding protein